MPAYTGNDASSTVIHLSSNNSEGMEALADAATAAGAAATTSTTAVPITARFVPAPVAESGDSWVLTSSSLKCSGTCSLLAASFFLLLFVFVAVTMLAYPVTAILQHEVFGGLCFLVLFGASLAVASYCWLKVFVTPPGPLKPYMSAQRVEEVVKDAVRDICVRELGEDFEHDNSADFFGNSRLGRLDREAETSQPLAHEDHMQVNAVLASKAASRQSAGDGDGGWGWAAEGADEESEEEAEEEDEEGHANSDAATLKDPILRARAEKYRREREEKKAAKRAKKLLADEQNSGGDDEASPEVRESRERRQRARRRLRRMRHGLDLPSLGDAAKSFYAILNGNDVAERERTVAYYLKADGTAACQDCHVYKIQSIVHCQTCGRCSVGQDQHCFLLGTCIGRDNHKYMILFELYALLTMAIAAILSIYAVAKGYTFFFRYEEANLAFYLAFCLDISNLFVLLPLIGQHVYLNIGRGLSSDAVAAQETRTELAGLRREEDGVVYQPMTSEEPLAEPGRFSWDNLQTVFGEDRRLWTWLVPTMAPLRPRPDAQERQFLLACTEAVERNLRASVVLTRADEEEYARRDPLHRHRQDVGVVAVSVEDGTGEAAQNSQAAAQLVDRFTNPQLASLSSTTGMGTSATAAAAPARGGSAGLGNGAATTRAGILSTAGNPTTPTTRPVIQRIPFFAKRSSAYSANDGGSVPPHDHVSAAAAAAAAGPGFRTVDPFEVYNQPAAASSSATAALSVTGSSVHGALNEGPPVAASQSADPTPLLSQPHIPQQHQQPTAHAAPPSNFASAGASAAAHPVGVPGAKRPIHRTKTD